MPNSEVPPVVTDAARQRQLGQLVLTQRAPTRRGDLIKVMMFFGIAALVLGAVLVPVSVAVDGRRLGFLALVCFALGAVLLIFAVRTSLERHQSYYLYAGGLVAHVGRRARAAAWPDIAALNRRRVDVEKMARVGIRPENLGVRPDSVIGYDIALNGGGKLFLKVGNVAEDQARFCATLEQLGQQARVRISG
jgi:hypothetical protein